MRATLARVSRRRVGILLAISLLVAPLALEAQQVVKVLRLGVLWAYSQPVGAPFAEAFRQGLRSLGYVEGQNILLAERWAEGKLDRLPALATELVRLNVDVIVTVSTPAVQAAQRATKTIPIVMTLSATLWRVV